MRRCLADAISLSRVALLPLWALAWGSGSGASLPVMAVMAMSDVADGAVARRLGTASAAGANLDSLCDLGVILVVFCLMGGSDPRYWCLAFLAVLNFCSWFLRRWPGAIRSYTRAGKYNGVLCYGLICMGCVGQCSHNQGWFLTGAQTVFLTGVATWLGCGICTGFPASELRPKAKTGTPAT
jgi:phosphatidylglycerophosphate synthase